MIFVFKVAGALAETGASLQDVCEIALETNSNIRTLGVALSPCILPEAGKPTFEINDDEIEIGMGCLLYTSPSPRDRQKSRMPSSA